MEINEVKIWSKSKLTSPLGKLVEGEIKNGFMNKNKKSVMMN